MKSRIICLAALFFLNSYFQESFAQSSILDSLLNSGERNLFKIQKIVESYYKDKDKGRGSGYTRFKKWEYNIHFKVDADGNIPNHTQDLWENYHKYTEATARRSALRMQSTFNGNWSTLGPGNYILGSGWNGGIGRVNCIAIDPSNSNIVYAGTPAGGLWKSTTGGNSWVPLTDGMPQIGISSIVIDPISTSTIYILTGDCDGRNTYSIGVLKSTDGGNTWYSTGLVFTSTQYVIGHKMVMHPTDNKTLFVASSEGLYKTTDGGISWNLAINFTNATYTFTDVKFKPASNTVYACNYDHVYKSTDGGTNWKIVNAGLPSNLITRKLLAVSPANPNYLYIIYESAAIPQTGKFGGLYRSMDSGESFTLRSDSPNIYGYDEYGLDGKSQASYDLAIAVSPTNVNEVHVGGINCWKSSDGGQSWNITSHWVEYNKHVYGYTHADIHYLGFFGSTLYCGSDGGIFKSTNNASQWEDLSAGLEITQIYRIGTNPHNSNNMLYGAQDNGTNSLINKVSTHMLGADGFECIVSHSDQNVLYGSIQFGDIKKSIDGGLSFYNAKPPVGYGNWLTPFVMSESNSNLLFAGYTDLHKTEDGGSSWSNISSGLIGTSQCDHIAIAPSNNNYIYALKGYEGLYRTTNGSTNWVNINGTTPKYGQTFMAVHPEFPDVVWSTYSNGKIYKTSNGGNTWQDVSGSLPAISINCIVYQKGTMNGIYIGTDAGIFYKDDNLSDWIPFDNGLPKIVIKELEIDYTSNKIRSATYGRGLWESDLYNSNSCPMNYTFTDNGTITGTVSLEASDFISSNKQVTGGTANVTYKAGNKVTLTPGFRVQNGNKFKATIGSCTSPVRLSSTKEITGTYAGPLPGVVEPATEGINADLEENMYIYPNPFSSVTTIDFRVNETSVVSISLFDIFGKKVANIVQLKSYDKGTYKVTFDGSQIPNGISYCILNANDKKFVSKVVITK